MSTASKDYTDPGPVAFDGQIETAGDNGGAYIVFPFSVEELYGVKGRVPAHMTFDGIPYRGSLAKMDSGCHLVPVLKDVRAKLSKDIGDSVHAIITLDTDERIVTLDMDVQKAWRDAGVLDAYRALSYTHQREYAQWIAAAKKPETRASRIANVVAALR